MDRNLPSTFFLFLSLLLVGLTTSSCNGTKPADDPANAPVGSSNTLSAIGNLQTIQTVGLYEYPKLESEVVRVLPVGETLITTPEVSEDWVFIDRAGQATCEPWLRVQTKEKETGWVVAAAEDFEIPSSLVLSWQRNNRLRSLLPETSLQQLRGYQQAWERTDQSSVLLVAVRNALAIQDQLRTAVSALPCQPESNWLAPSWPGFVFQPQAPGELPLLWQDYGQCLARATQTKGDTDDRLFQLYCQIYPQDSIAYHYSAWQFPEPEGDVYSLLGRGIHLDLLTKADQLFAAEPFLEPELRQITKAIITDILDAPAGYWERRERIVEELEAICNARWRILEQPDLVLLHRRLKAFSKSDGSAIPTGLRLGRLES